MEWAGKSHPLEIAAEWGAPIVLGAASGWAAMLARLPLAAIAAAGMVGLAVGVITIRLAGKQPLAVEAGFEPVEFKPAPVDEALLLDDPLVEVASDSRVVQLFARQDPTPGDLVLRISDYLNNGDRVSVVSIAPGEQPPVDASAALYAALANVRASLR